MNLSYNNDSRLKRALIREMKGHIKADRLIKGTYGRNDVPIEAYRGCSVGCSIVSLNRLTGKSIRVHDHHDLARAIGLPDCGWLTKLQDRFFEILPEPEHQQWSLDFLKAIPVGVHVKRIQLVKWQFLEGILTDVLALDNFSYDVASAITRVRDLCLMAGAGNMPPENEWVIAANTAHTAEVIAYNAYIATETHDRPAHAAVVAVAAAIEATRAADKTVCFTYNDANAIIDAMDKASRATADIAYVTADSIYDAVIDARRKWANLLLNLLRKADE